MTNNQKIDNDRDITVTNRMKWILRAAFIESEGDLDRKQARAKASAELNFCSVCHASDAWPLCDHCTEIAIDVRED